MPVCKITITGPVSLGGKRPGETFTLPCDDNGLPLDRYWRRRLDDDRKHGGGHVIRAGDVVAVAAPTAEPDPLDAATPTEEPAASKTAPARKKG